MLACRATRSTCDSLCVSCDSLYKNATTCTRSIPLTCSYGVVHSARKCAAVDCSKTSGTYLSTDAKQCLPCTDPNALTCNSTTPFTCQANYRLSSERTGSPICYKGNLYIAFFHWGLAKPFQSNQQPFKPNNRRERRRYHVYCRSLQRSRMGPWNKNLVKTFNVNAVVFLKGYCLDYVKSSFVTANKTQGASEEGFVTPRWAGIVGNRKLILEIVIALKMRLTL